MKIILDSLEKTNSFGFLLGKLLKGKMVVCLNGDLGAGKTTITKSIARGMGIKAIVTSPTFTIVNEYTGNPCLYHIDTYRLTEGIDTDYLGFDEYFYSDGVTIIEWADKIKNSLPEEYLNINIKVYDKNREINISHIGKKYEEIEEKLYESFGL